jgi:signal transduction histidine kinase
MAFAGSDSVLVFRELTRTSNDIRQRFLTRNRLLDRIRSGIFLSGTLARDFLLAPGETGTAVQRERMRQVQNATRAAVDEYSSLLEGVELTTFSNLGGEIHAYFKLLDLILEWRTPETRRSGYSYLHNEIVRRRAAMLAIADRISAMNEHELVLGDQRSAQAFDRFRIRLGVTVAVTLIVGVFLSWLTLRRLFSLEREADERYEESTRARAELQELSARLLNAQEEERRAISRELHDEVGQSLSALLVETGNAAATVPANGAIRPHLDAIRTLAESCVRVIRNMSLLLRPSMLDDLGLVPALEWQARATTKRTGVLVRVTADEGADDLSEEQRTCIYRVVQEALNNVTRHARAANVAVDLVTTRSMVSVTIADDGRGFDATRTRGMGLLGMEERVTHLDGTFSISSSPGVGAAVRVELPRTPVDARAMAGAGG